jgi:hypothetical protein
MDNYKLAQVYMAALQAAVADMCITVGDEDLKTLKSLIRTYTDRGLERIESNPDMYIMPPNFVQEACSNIKEN